VGTDSSSASVCPANVRRSRQQRTPSPYDGLVGGVSAEARASERGERGGDRAAYRVGDAAAGIFAGVDVGSDEGFGAVVEEGAAGEVDLGAFVGEGVAALAPGEGGAWIGEEPGADEAFAVDGGGLVVSCAEEGAELLGALPGLVERGVEEPVALGLSEAQGEDAEGGVAAWLLPGGAIGGGRGFGGEEEGASAEGGDEIDGVAEGVGAFVAGGVEDASKARLEGEACDLASEGCDGASVVEAAEASQLLVGGVDGVVAGRIEELEASQVEAAECGGEDGLGEGGAEELGRCGLVEACQRAPEADAGAGAEPPGASAALARRRPGRWGRGAGRWCPRGSAAVGRGRCR
jgi:hypothetical protein